MKDPVRQLARRAQPRAGRCASAAVREVTRDARRPAAAPRTARSSRWPTRARSSGISRTPPGSSRPSSSRRPTRLRAVRSRVPRALQFLLQRAWATSTRARSAACSRARRSTTCCAYRAHVDDGDRSRSSPPDASMRTLAALVELGLQHEQQHQELILTDMKHLLSCNPLRPVYRQALAAHAGPAAARLRGFACAGGLQAGRARRRRVLRSTTRRRATACGSTTSRSPRIR